MQPRFPIGISDFRKLREQGYAYVDKSHLIREVLERGAQVILLPRPRRFGKTVGLSMLRCFFEKRDEDLSHLFQGLSIGQSGEASRAHFQRYPVIYLTFKDIKSESFEGFLQGARSMIEVLFDEHRYLLDGGALSEREAAEYREILARSADAGVYRRALAALSRYLHRHHGEKVITLIDEYDAPIHAAYFHGHAPAVLDFFRAFMTAGLKDNPHVEKAVLTGILRVAKESIFSDLNNLDVYSLLHPHFSTCFGFTEPEVVALLATMGRSGELDVVRTWYNGYIFGDAVIYNPWSILKFLDDPRGEPQPFWITTSSNDLVKELLQHHAPRVEPAFEALLEGEVLERVLDENVVLADLREDESALWSLLVFSGYLKAEKVTRGPMERPAHRLSIPNREVRELYTTTFRRSLRDRLGGGEEGLAHLTSALLRGDAPVFEEQLQAFTKNLLSYHDTKGLHPEQVYHAFVIGLLAALEPDYAVRSNRESGQGRPDVTIRPTRPGKPGIVMELKVAKRGKKTPAAALREALKQLEGLDYSAELQAAGAEPVHAFAVVFDGKRVWVKAAVKAAGAKSRRRTAGARSRSGR